MKFVEYSFNGKYFRSFKVFVSQSKGLLDKLKPKAKKTYDWAEHHGKEVDLSKPKYEEREIELKGWVEGETWQEMKQNFDTLLSEFDKEGLVRLVVDFGKELVYDVYLTDEVALEKTFREGRQVGFFTLKMREPNPVKKVLKLEGDNLQLSFISHNWVEVNIDGVSESHKGEVSLTKPLKNRIISSNVSGRNLMLDSKSFFMSGNDYKKSDNSNKGRIIVNNTKETWNAYQWVTLSEGFKLGEDAVFSIEVKSSINCEIGIVFFPYYNTQNSVQKHTLSANVWKRVFVKSKVFEIKDNGDLINIIGSNMNNAIVEFRNAKIERGNIYTDWTIAPEEAHFITISGEVEGIKNLETNAEIIWNYQ